MVVFVAALLSRLPEGMFVACSPGSSRCPLPQYHKRLPPIGHEAPRAHVKAEALDWGDVWGEKATTVEEGCGVCYCKVPEASGRRGFVLLAELVVCQMV